jgi:hypothetical protein
MAKISARGATEVARRVEGDMIYVLTSDGRVLRKIKYSTFTDRFTVVAQGKNVSVETFNRYVDRRHEEQS